MTTIDLTEALPAPTLYTQVAVALLLNGIAGADAACGVATEAEAAFGAERCDDEHSLRAVLQEMTEQS